MAPTPTQKLLEEKARQADRQLDDYSDLLESVGNFFIETLPSDLGDEDILNVEQMLNELYIKSWTKGSSSTLHSQLQDALGKAAELSSTIKTKSPRRDSFFKTAKKLGEVLLQMTTKLK